MSKIDKALIRCVYTLPNLGMFYIFRFVDALCEIIKHSRNLQHFTLGCIPELNDFVEPLLRLLAIHQANSMQSLHLAGVKADPEFYQLAQISPHCFHSLRNLQVLSIDHDYVSDEMLKPFLSSTPQKRAPLKSLIMHVHGKEVPRNTVSNVTWQEMMKYNPQLEVTLTLIHSVDGMNKLLDILKPAMPLTHLHMLFCYEMNISAIVFIQRHLWRQLKTFYVVEGMVDNIPMVYEDIEATNPFVMLAWKCINLQQFTFIGNMGDFSFLCIYTVQYIRSVVSYMYMLHIYLDDVMFCKLVLSTLFGLNLLNVD